MEIHVDVLRYPLAKLKEAYREIGSDDDELLDKILGTCGLVLPESDSYILVNNEHKDDLSPYYALISMISSAWPEMKSRRYGTWSDGAHGPLLELYEKIVGQVEALFACEELGIEYEEE
jgi:hypothetical protein